MMNEPINISHRILTEFVSEMSKVLPFEYFSVNVKDIEEKNRIEFQEEPFEAEEFTVFQNFPPNIEDIDLCRTQMKELLKTASVRIQKLYFTKMFQAFNRPLITFDLEQIKRDAKAINSVDKMIRSSFERRNYDMTHIIMSKKTYMMIAAYTAFFKTVWADIPVILWDGCGNKVLFVDAYRVRHYILSKIFTTDNRIALNIKSFFGWRLTTNPFHFCEIASMPSVEEPFEMLRTDNVVVMDANFTSDFDANSRPTSFDSYFGMPTKRHIK